MVARVATVALRGIDTLDIDVQAHLANAMPAFSIVGLPAKSVDESKDRVRSALSALGLSLLPQRITVNLSPADVVKEGSHYDLPIALAILAAMGVVTEADLAGHLVLGELALDGKLTPGGRRAAGGGRRVGGRARHHLPRRIRAGSGLGRRHRDSHPGQSRPVDQPLQGQPGVEPAAAGTG